MPTIARIGPYRIYFYSQDRREPPHVHIDRDAHTAKFWLAPVELAYNIGFVDYLQIVDSDKERPATGRSGRVDVSRRRYPRSLHARL